MDDLTSLVRQGRLLIGYALTHNVALPDAVLKTLDQADAALLQAQPAAREAYLAAFAAAGRTLGVATADIAQIAARNERLRPLVDAALTLLNYAAANARPVDDETRNCLLATEAAIQSGTTTLAQDQAFLKAYEDLSKALAPITVETLDASTTRLPSIFDLLKLKADVRPAMWTLGRFINASVFIVVLAFTGISLAYYSVGATALAKYRELRTTMDTLKQKEAEAARDLAVKQQARVQIAKAREKAASAPADPQDENAAANAVARSESELALIVAQRFAVDAELKAIPERLGRWAQQPCVSHNFVFNAALCAGVDARPAATAASGGGDDQTTASLRGSLVDVEAARTVVARMSDVYLPLLLGFLGAHAFILRRMSKEITEKTFAKGSAFNHIVRTGLGALAGLASTWMLTPELVGGATFKALPTWALAFVAGYGIELVFAFMDRIIAAFTTPAK